MIQLSNVLIVEDEGIVALDLEQKLKSMDYTVNIARSGEAALNIIETNKFDLILMDVYLNEGLNGIDTAIQIRNNFNTPIIYITGSHDPRKHEEISKTEPYAFIKKPFDDIQLKETIKNYI